MDLASRIEAARGNKPVDLLLKNGRLVNVLSGEIHDASVAVHEGLVVGFGDYDAFETVDVDGRYIAPGFIDGHVHLESTMLSIPEFARNVVPTGTTAVVGDPHEIANVLGVPGIRFMLDSSEDLPLRVFLMFPSCVPATPFETSGAELLHGDMAPFVDDARMPGLAEVMNYPGVVWCDPELLAKITVYRDKVIDGHAPGLTGKDLCAYVSAGIGSDHECTTLEEAKEKLRAGMSIMIREGSAAKNLNALLPLVNDYNAHRCFFVSDDLDPKDLMEEGHLDRIVRMAVGKGLDPVRAIQMVTINPASYFRLHGLGAVAPGYCADIVLIDDLQQFNVSSVYHAGRLVAEKGKIVAAASPAKALSLPPTMHVNWEKVTNLAIPAERDRVNVIGVIPHQIVTNRMIETAHIVDGQVVADPAKDVLKIAVIERHRATGSHCVGLIRGFGLKRGAMACTVAHDSHNIVVVGVDDRDMLAAAKAVATLGGGMAVVKDGETLAQLPLPIAGLMSDRPVGEVVQALQQVVTAAHDLGCALDEPFATLSFMALTPIPELKITDQGLLDSANFRPTTLFATE